MERSTTIRIEHRGQEWSGEYTIDGRTLRVGGAYGAFSVPLMVEDDPGALAQEVLRDLVDIWCSTR